MRSKKIRKIQTTYSIYIVLYCHIFTFDFADGFYCNKNPKNGNGYIP